MKNLSFRILRTERTETPINVQVWIENYYCGIGRFCRNEGEAYEYISSYIKRYPSNERRGKEENDI